MHIDPLVKIVKGILSIVGFSKQPKETEEERMLRKKESLCKKACESSDFYFIMGAMKELDDHDEYKGRIMNRIRKIIRGYKSTNEVHLKYSAGSSCMLDFPPAVKTLLKNRIAEIITEQSDVVEGAEQALHSLQWRKETQNLVLMAFKSLLHQKCNSLLDLIEIRRTVEQTSRGRERDLIIEIIDEYFKKLLGGETDPLVIMQVQTRLTEDDEELESMVNFWFRGSPKQKR